MDLIHGVVDWMLSWAGTPYALAALFILTFWESSFFPVPTDPLLIAMAVANPQMALFYALVCTVASVMGAAFGYLIGIKGGRPIAHRIFKEERLNTAERLYQRYDAWAVGAAALTPIPYKVFTITAGIAKINFPRFILVSILGRGARFFALGIAIYFFGASIQTAIDEYFEFLTVGFLVLLVAGFIAVKYIGSHLAKKEAAEKSKALD